MVGVECSMNGRGFLYIPDAHTPTRYTSASLKEGSNLLLFSFIFNSTSSCRPFFYCSKVDDLDRGFHQVIKIETSDWVLTAASGKIRETKLIKDVICWNQSAVNDMCNYSL